MKKLKQLFVFLSFMLGILLVSCQSSEKQEQPDSSAIPKKEVSETTSIASCQMLDESKVKSIIGIENNFKTTEKNRKTGNQCLYSFQGGSMYIIKHNGIPKNFEGDNSRYLEAIFQNYETGAKPRSGFERVEGLGFPAGWSNKETQFFGNTLEFVVDNERYTIQVKIPAQSDEELKSKAIELAKLL